MLSDNIKRLMTVKNITSKKLAEMVGVSPTHISYILNNKREPSMELLNKIATALGVSIDEVFQTKSLNEPSSSSKNTSHDEKKKQISTVAAHLEEKNLTPQKLKLLNDYIDILFNDEF
ncbi:helix-turn-helix domain-containing protein [Clostridium saccharobutylicum]|uniref:Helix-turn-helix domain protein n=1 Tax=Clostridium saccharobutylicum DSM 13864 TaxID=1345695 RepID=U5MKZ3_CLOSA|nr:helix-turn-helix transcriptional regulator [Clostridium saccharobutylicum]AGX41444.1 helix-turn-helix domain protein [Clostridium saccharobutylicum DSM 13864]AQR88725.1 anaerobic benzoate catabolism transcriptional regulator [Clostridium saccharobutylicum]AQR98623.1 anaerobic benzoate catabolism transcriptional regulator [Clostridium saccharobutylicum]AQS08344.1 anaerobic benzoate catabolism transcriptional regulator [Clostridium saccharobutylicum]AQS12613.1 anaerobic benzoate catabolism tr